MKDNIQSKLKDFFSQLGLSYDEIVSRCSISKNTLNKLLNHNFNPTLHTLIELSYATGHDLLSFYSTTFKFEKMIIYQTIRYLIMNNLDFSLILFETLKNNINVLKERTFSDQYLKNNSEVTLLEYFENYKRLFEFCFKYYLLNNFKDSKFINDFKNTFHVDLNNFSKHHYNYFQKEYILVAIILLTNKSNSSYLEIMTKLYDDCKSNECKLCLLYLCCRDSIMFNKYENFYFYYSESISLLQNKSICVNKQDFDNLLILLNTIKNPML